MPDGGRPDYLVNVTKDGWFGRSAGPYQHLDAARLRAIEEGLPLVRAANTGISAIVDAYGRNVASLPIGEEGVLDGHLPAERPPVVFHRVGPAFLLTFLMVSLLLSLSGKGKRRPRS